MKFKFKTWNSPYLRGVVEFEGKAYLRINNETREMNDKLKQLIKTKKAKI